MKRSLTAYFLVIIHCLFLCGCIPDANVKIPFNMVPLDIGDGWEISTPALEGLNSDSLRKAYELFFSEDDFITAISLLVVRNGKLVSEGYCRDIDDRFLDEHVASVTKSIVSLVFGIALREGYLDSIDQTLYSILPDKFDTNLKKRTITLRHCLTLSSGIDFENRDFAKEMIILAPTNQAAHILAKPLFTDPGVVFHYRDCDPQLLSSAIHTRSGRTLEEIAEEFLFKPMGIRDYFWEKNVDGESFASFGLYARARDLAKIGLLVCNLGMWNGEQLVPQDWIEASTSFQRAVPDDEWGYPYQYGFCWWIIDELHAFTANGNGGNYIFVVPDKELVIVFTAECSPQFDTDINISMQEFVPFAKRIIDAIQ